MLLTKKKKKLVAFLILVLFLYNSLGYLVLYFPSSLLIKHFVHKSIKEKKISPEDLSVLVFSISDLESNKL